MNAALGMDERARDLQELEMIWKGLQYADRPYTWDGFDKSVVKQKGAIQFQITQMPPRCQREPRVKSGIAKVMVSRFTSMLFGEKHVPTLHVEGDPQTEDWLEAAWDQAELWSTMNDARNYGGGMGTAVIILWLQDGYYYSEAINPKWCYPKWKDRGQLIMSELEIRYQYPIEVPKPGNQGSERKWFWYRRLITEKLDATWRDVPVKKDEGVPTKWGTPERIVEHNLGWCPAEWVQNEPVEAQIDGICDFDGQQESIESYDYVLSEQTGGTLANLDPTLILKAREIDKPVDTGHHTALCVGESGDAKLLEMSGANAEAGIKTAMRLRASILEACSCVLIDPTEVTGLGQGKDLMESLYRPMIAKCDGLRETYGKHIKRLAMMILDLASAKHNMTVELADGTMVKQVIKLPDKVVKYEQDGTTYVRRTKRSLGKYNPNTTIEIGLSWPEYFAPTAEDRKNAALTASQLARDILVSLDTRTRFLASYFPIDDVQAEMDAIRQEKEESAFREANAMMRMSGMPLATGNNDEPEPEDEDDEDTTDEKDDE